MKPDLLGRRFGRLVAVALVTDKRGKSVWRCKCDCGNITHVYRTILLIGKSTSCGCSKWGQTKLPEYRSWLGMKARCLNEKSKRYQDYGGRGITMCDRWQQSFSAFLEDMGPRPSELHSLDRINNDGNYEPGNCRWATKTQQNNNKRNTKFLRVGRELMTVREASERYGVTKCNLHARIKAGWKIMDALHKPPRPWGR